MDLPITYPIPIIIKEEEDDLNDIIDLDLYGDKTPEDLVYEWDEKVRLKIMNFFMVDSEQCLDTLMKWYIQSMKNEMGSFDDCQFLNLLIAKHIQFFKLYFVELNSCFVDNYLDNMEDILTFYLNAEIKSFPRKRKKLSKQAFKRLQSSMRQKIISMLNLYLLNREERVYHVVMKIKLSSIPEDKKELLNLLYRQLLMKIPSDKSDLGFCRAYILYQKWKTVVKPEEWETMDEVMYKFYDRTAESVKTNEILSQILLPQNNSLLDILVHISEKHVIITEKYFNFLQSQKSQEKCEILPEIGNIEINDEILPDLTDNNDDEEFDKEYQNFVKSMSSLTQDRSHSVFDDCPTVKLEDSDDDCQIVSVTTLSPQSEDEVHAVYDDGSDDPVEMWSTKKGEQIVKPKVEEKSALSFLDSIEIPDLSDVPTEKVSSSSNTTFLPSKPSTNMVTTSIDNSPDDPKWNTSSLKSAVPMTNPNISTSNAQGRTKPDTDHQWPSMTTSISLEIDTECIPSPSTTADMETSGGALAVSHSTQIKSNLNTQIQTDTVVKNVADGSDYAKLPILSEKRMDGDPSTYIYGLITPPSDQPPDEHISPTDSNVYPNVYAKIARTHDSPDQTDDTVKISSYLPCSMEVNQKEHAEPLPSSSETNETDGLILPLPDQSTNHVDYERTFHQDDDSNAGSDMELEPNIEPSAKNKPDILDRGVASTCPSPDITSTSTDVRDFHENFSVRVGNSVQDHVVCADFSRDASETERSYLNRQCTEKYAGYTECDGDNRDLKNNENVSQSNLDDSEEGEKICIEDTVLLNNEEESDRIRGANANKSLDSHSNESSVHELSDAAGGGKVGRIVEAGMVNQVKKVTSFKESSVAVEKINGGVENGKIMYTSSEKVKMPSVDKFTLFQDSLCLNDDDIFSGPVTKVNGSGSFVNIDKSLDLFNSKASTISDRNSPLTPVNSSGNSTGELTSPAYEGMDDFRNFFEENKNRNMLGLSSAHNKSPPPVSDRNGCSPATLGGNGLKRHKNNVKTSCLIDRDENLKRPASIINRKGKALKTRAPPNGRRKTRIAFAEHVIDTSDTVAHCPTESHNDVLQGILKKPPSNAKKYRENAKNTTYRIPSGMINLESLAYYGIKISDKYLQANPHVLVERLTESKIQDYMRINEFSRKVRLEKEQAQCALQSCRVDYDKSTKHVNENDVLSIGKKKMPLKQFTSNSSSVDEGLIFHELPYTEKKNGKRKRNSQNSLNSDTARKRPVFRKASENKIEQLGIRKTTRKRKKPEKDYESLTRSGGRRSTRSP